MITIIILINAYWDSIPPLHLWMLPAIIGFAPTFAVGLAFLVLPIRNKYFGAIDD